MKIVLVDRDSGVRGGGNGYSNDLAQSIQFTAAAEAKQFCVEKTYSNHNIIELDSSRRHGRFVDQC